MCGHEVHEFIGFIEKLMEVAVVLEIDKAVSRRLESKQFKKSC
jgi:hypothetical protein